MHDDDDWRSKNKPKTAYCAHTIYAAVMLA